MEYGSNWQFSSQVKFLSPLTFDLSVPSEVNAEIIIEWHTNPYFCSFTGFILKYSYKNSSTTWALLTKLSGSSKGSISYFLKVAIITSLTFVF